MCLRFLILILFNPRHTTGIHNRCCINTHLTIILILFVFYNSIWDRPNTFRPKYHLERVVSRNVGLSYMMCKIIEVSERTHEMRWETENGKVDREVDLWMEIRVFLIVGGSMKLMKESSSPSSSSQKALDVFCLVAKFETLGSRGVLGSRGGSLDGDWNLLVGGRISEFGDGIAISPNGV